MEALDSQEVTEWMASEEVLGPLGTARLDLLAGTIAAAQVNVWRGKDDEPASPLDFVPDWGGLRAREEEDRAEERRRQEAEAMRMWGAVRMTVGQGV